MSQMMDLSPEQNFRDVRDRTLLVASSSSSWSASAGGGVVFTTERVTESSSLIIAPPVSCGPPPASCYPASGNEHTDHPESGPLDNQLPPEMRENVRGQREQEERRREQAEQQQQRMEEASRVVLDHWLFARYGLTFDQMRATQREEARENHESFSKLVKEKA